MQLVTRLWGRGQGLCPETAPPCPTVLWMKSFSGFANMHVPARPMQATQAGPELSGPFKGPLVVGDSGTCRDLAHPTLSLPGSRLGCDSAGASLTLL